MTPDNDSTSFSVGDVSISEGGLMTFTVTRTGNAEANQTVDFATSLAEGNTAESGDFTANSGTLTFALGETSKTFTVQSTVDAVFEGGETFTVTLSNNSAGSTILDATGTGTILDDGTGPGPFGPDPLAGPDDDRPSLTVTGKDDVSEGSNAIFTVSLGTASASATEITLTLGAVGDTAVSADYSSTMTAYYYVGSVKTDLPITDGKISLPPGVSSFFVSVVTNSDSPKVLEGAESFTLAAAITAGASDSDTATIVDDGSGKVYDDKGVIDPLATPDDDRPVASTPPPEAPPAPAPAPAPLAPPDSPIAPMPPFDSATLLPERSPLPLLQDRQDTFQDTLTSDAGFPVVVVEGTTPRLTVNSGITDQFVESNALTRFALPFDAFAHTKSDAVISLQAKLADGSNLPSWVQFDAQSGTFQVNPPADFNGELKIMVIARDAEGREATAPFRFFVGQDKDKGKPQAQGRLSLSEQIKLAGKRPAALADLLRNADGKPVAGKLVVEQSPAKVPAVREVATV